MGFVFLSYAKRRLRSIRVMIGRKQMPMEMYGEVIQEARPTLGSCWQVH